jgi:hypothetical protein
LKAIAATLVAVTPALATAGCGSGYPHPWCAQIESILNGRTSPDGTLSAIAKRWPGTPPSPLISTYGSDVSALGLADVPNGCGLSTAGCPPDVVIHHGKIEYPASRTSAVKPHARQVLADQRRIDAACGAGN